MIPYLDIMTNCSECNNCILICPENAILKDDDNNYVVQQWKCSLCMLCSETCPDDAITLKEKEDTIP